MSKVRRSRCVSIATLTVLVYVIIFYVLNYSEHRPLGSAKWSSISLDFLGLRHFFMSGDTRLLDTWAEALFRKKLVESPDDNTMRMAKYVVDGPEKSRHVVPLPPFLRGKGENPHFTPFDPRLTFGIQLDDLNTQFASGVPLDQIQMRSFHWGDWTDLSSLNRKILLVVDSQETCESLNPLRYEKISGQKDLALDATEYCLSEEDVAYYLNHPHESPVHTGLLVNIIQLEFKTRYHVFDGPLRASQRIRILSSASFLHDFMPPPSAVHFLLPTGPKDYSSLHVPVSQDPINRIYLAQTPLAAAAAKKGRSIDLRKQLKQLVANVGQKTKTKLKYLKEIPHEDFIDKLEEIAAELSQETKLSHQDQLYLDSLKLSLNTTSPPKYFYEARLPLNERGWVSGGHYDWKFFKGLKINSDVHLPHLHGLILAWLRFTNANDITTWIAHGSLLGWYWNGLSFPWDADYDVQVPITDLHKLARKFNQTIIVDFGGDSSDNVRLGRFFLDCGTWISHRERGNGQNNIDARFIDMDSGLYVDITGLAVSSLMAPERYDKIIPGGQLRPTNRVQAPNPTAERRINNAAQLYNCRNKHFLSLLEISPLRLTMMEGVPAYIPKNFTQMLQIEYGEKGTVSLRFKAHLFLPKLRLWGSSIKVGRYTKEHSAQHPEVELEADKKIPLLTPDNLSVFSLSEEDYIELMSLDKELLFEYLVTKENTLFHQKEMDLLLQGESTEHLFFKDDEVGPPWKHLRPDISNFVAVKENRSFSKEMAEYVKMYEAYKAGKEYIPDEEPEKSFISWLLGKEPKEIPKKQSMPELINRPGANGFAP